MGANEQQIHARVRELSKSMLHFLLANKKKKRRRNKQNKQTNKQTKRGLGEEGKQKQQKQQKAIKRLIILGRLRILKSTK